MKNLYIFMILVLLIHRNSPAQDLIAVQNGGIPKFFSDFAKAVTEAQAKDTIFLPGYTYQTGNNGSITIDKELHIIGVGHNPDSTLSTGFTQINGTIVLGNGSSNGSIEGIYLNGDISFGKSGDFSFVNGFSIFRSNLASFYIFGDNTQIRYSNNSIIENVIRTGIYNGVNSAYFVDFQANLFSNNIIMIQIIGLGYNNIFKNNDISVGFPSLYLESVNGCLFENNIFGYPLPSSSVWNCTFRNNLSAYALYANIGIGTNVFTNNLIESPRVLTESDSFNSSYSYSYDFHLNPASIGKNAGRDGTDIGIYGGASPWKEGSIPINPHFQIIKVAPKTINSGDLNVKIKVAAQDH